MHEWKSGIYQIRNLVTGKVYVGSSKNIRLRWYVHAHELKKNKHHSVLLQRAYNKYGKDAFVYEILTHCPPVKDILEFFEQHHLDATRCWNPAHGYNILRLANFPVRLPDHRRGQKEEVPGDDGEAELPRSEPWG